MLRRTTPPPTRKKPPNPKSAAELNPKQSPSPSPKLKSPRPKRPRNNPSPRKILTPRRSKTKKKKRPRNLRRKAVLLKLQLLLRRRLRILTKQTTSQLPPDRSASLLLSITMKMRTRPKSLRRRSRSVVVRRRLLDLFFLSFQPVVDCVQVSMWREANAECVISSACEI